MRSFKLARVLTCLVVAGTAVGGLSIAPALADDAVQPTTPPATAAPSPTASLEPAVPSTIPEMSVPSPLVTVPAPSASTIPNQPQEPTPAVKAERPTNGGAIMGQAGKQTPKTASSLAQRFSASNEPTVNEQPPGTDGKPLGLDVSGWQQNVNWAVVKNSGARFAYVKTSEGPWTLNDYFSQQYNGAANVGLLRGGYHFARPNLSSGASQARVMLASGGGWTNDGRTLPPALDIEDNPYVASDGTNKCYGMTPTALVTWMKDFTNTIKSSTGKEAVIYSSYYFWQECLGGSNAFANSNPLWIAAYYAASPWMPGGWPNYTFWQYANNFANAAQTIPATFPGDQNVFNGTMDQLRELAGVIQQPFLGKIAGATAVSGKWAGDGRSYVGWYKDGRWCLEMPAFPQKYAKCFYYGDAGDKPVVGDWNGDGNDTVGVVRGDAWLLNNNLNRLTVDAVQTYGLPSDTPLIGDWDGDGKTTVGIFRQGEWHLSNSQARWPQVAISTRFGDSTDTPVVGDWNADQKDTVGVWRKGYYYLSDATQRPTATAVFEFGIGTDQPATGDWDGDQRTTVGIERNGVWHLTSNLGTRQIDSVRS